jgi:opacity protein-like surface antigen
MPVLARCFAASWILLLAGVAVAQSTDDQISQEDRIAELERTVKVLADELERTRAEVAVPEEEELVSRYGLGPAASKIYGVTRGISFGGYAEGFYQNLFHDANGGRDNTDLLRAVLYAGYKFDERLVFNAEFEFEHGTTSTTKSSGGGSVSVEFATLDYFAFPWANARAGLLLIPMGFINQLHEPTTFYGVHRPDVERRLIPTTWRENGVGLFGEIGEQISYELYVTNGLNAEGYDASGIRDARQLGNRALAEDLAFTGRVDFTPLPGLLVGASTFIGNAGQDQSFTVTGVPTPVKMPSVFTAVWDAHAQYEWQGLRLRGLFTMVHIDDAGSLTLALRPTAQGGINEIGASEVVASEMLGGYVEVAYDVLQWLLPGSERTLEPFFRFEYLDTQYDVPSGFTANQAQELQVYTAGLQFKLTPNVVLKADIRNKVAAAGSAADEFNLGMGLAF